MMGNRKTKENSKVNNFSQQSQAVSFVSETHSKRLQSIQSFLNLVEIENDKDPIQKLKHVQKSIVNKMAELDKLNVFYYDKQEKLFLKTFINIMDRMSNQLLQAKEKYDNIDQQITNQPECVRLRERLTFYKDECLYLDGQFKKIDEKYEQLKKFNSQKQGINEQLKLKLTQETKKQKKYKSRKYSLQTKIQNIDLNYSQNIKNTSLNYHPKSQRILSGMSKRKENQNNRKIKQGEQRCQDFYTLKSLRERIQKSKSKGSHKKISFGSSIQIFELNNYKNGK